MMQKKCPHCFKLSFSSYDSGEWIYPNCNKDISDVKAAVAENKSILRRERDKYA